VLDWYSRAVLAWDLSNTLDARFCVETVQRAIDQYGPPEIFNTDQGCQFTSADFTQPLLALGVKLSMDGKGRCLDNVFVERLWRTVKWDEVYRKVTVHRSTPTPTSTASSTSTTKTGRIAPFPATSRRWKSTVAKSLSHSALEPHSQNEQLKPRAGEELRPSPCTPSHILNLIYPIHCPTDGVHLRMNWTRDELLVALNLYHKLTFGQMHSRQPAIMALAEKLGRGPNSLAMKLCNFASLDPA